MTLKERVIEEIRKGIEEARREGVVIPHDVTDVVITPIKEVNHNGNTNNG